MERATELVLQICGGDAGSLTEQNNADGLQNKAAVDVRLARLKSMLGMELEKQETAEILSRVANQVVETDDGWSVSPPSYRFDIECEADLVEEVARVKGYENIPTVMPRIAPRSIVASESSVGLRQIKQSFIACDYREVINYSFIDHKSQSLFSDEEPIKLTNPLADNMSVMRTSLLPGLLKSLQFNRNRQHDRIRLFEVGATYHKRKDEGDAKTPFQETQRIAGVIYGSKVPMQWGSDNSNDVDFYDLKGDIESALTLTGSRKAIIFNEFHHIAMHPGQVSVLIKKAENELEPDIEIGHIGCLHPSLQKQYDLPNNVYVFELDLNAAFKATLPEFKSVSRFPSIKRDLSIIVDANISAGTINSVVKGALGDNLVNSVIFDVYMGDGVADHQKSVSLSLTLRQHGKTMTDEDAEQLTDTVLKELGNQIGAELRT